MAFLNKLTVKAKILIAAIILFAVAGTVTAVFLLPGGSKTAQKAYFEAESRNYKKYSAQIKDLVSRVRENYAVYDKSPYKRRTELTAGITSGDKNPFGLKNAQEFFDVIAKCKLITDSRRNPADKTSLTDISLLFDKLPFMDAALYSDEKNLTLTVPTLLPDRYFGLEKANLDKVYDRFGIPVRPEAVFNIKELVDNLDFSGESLDQSMSSVGTLISGMLPEANVTYGKSVTLEVAGKKADCREVLVSLNGEQTGRLLRELAKKLAAEDALISMTYGNASGISGMVRKAGLFSLLDFLEKSGLVVFNETEKAMIRGVNLDGDRAAFQKKLAGLFDGFEFAKGIEMTVLIDQQGNILDRKITLNAENKSSGLDYKVNLHTGTKNLDISDFRNFFMDVELADASSTGRSLQLHVETELKPGKEKGDIAGDIRAGYVENAAGTLKSSVDCKIKLDSALDKLTLKRHTQISYDIALDGAGKNDKGRFYGDIDNSSWSKKKFNTRNSNTGIVLNLRMPSFDAGDFSLKLNLAREDKFGIEAFTLPAVKKENIVYLDTATDGELTKLQGELLMSFGSFYITNKPVFDAILGNK